jgi:hypothetical protein
MLENILQNFDIILQNLAHFSLVFAKLSLNFSYFLVFTAKNEPF